MTAGDGPAARLQKLRQTLIDQDVPALFLTNLLNVRYISGFTGTAGQVLVTPTRAAIFVDSRYYLRAEEEAPLFEQVRVVSPKKPLEVVAEFIQDLQIEAVGFETSLSYDAYMDLAQKLPGVALKPVKDAVEQMRLIKDAGELECIRGAVAISDACYHFVLTLLAPGISERDVATEMEYFMRRSGADGEAFDSIVTSGPLGASPHAQATGKAIEKGDLVTLDFGAMFRGYAADITRTVAICRADEKQREVYSVVLEAQEKAIEAIRPGVRGSDVDRIARDLIAERGYGDCFGHGLGHNIGLHVHDGQALSPTSEAVLAPGMVVTVEPGIYIPGWGGIRIEDDVLVTESGVEILTQSPKEFFVVGPVEG